MVRKGPAASKKTGAGKWSGVETVALWRYEGVAVRLAKIPCGKANCSKCPHGPYWYLEFRSRGKWRHRYIGKSLEKGKWREQESSVKMVDLVMSKGRKVVGDASYG